MTMQALLGVFLSATAAGAVPTDPAVDANIAAICEVKAADDDAFGLCFSYLRGVYYQERTFGGWLGGIQAALRADIRSLNVGNFPTIRFGRRFSDGSLMRRGDSGAWEGSPDGRDEGEITLGDEARGLGAAAELLLDHEFCHHADAGHWDGTPAGHNPYGGSEEACYSVEGCLATGLCREPL